MQILIQSTFFLCVILFPVASLADVFSENKSFDFRKTKWGMSKKEVLKAEGILPKDSSEASLVFESVLANKNTLLEYFFSNGVLARAIYFINQGYYDPARHYQDFLLLNKLLKKKYGKSKDFKKIWSGTKSLRKEFDEPQAVYFGYLVLTTDWEIKRTLITHILKKSGSEGGMYHAIIFSDKNLQ